MTIRHSLTLVKKQLRADKENIEELKFLISKIIDNESLEYKIFEKVYDNVIEKLKVCLNKFKNINEISLDELYEDVKDYVGESDKFLKYVWGFIDIKEGRAQTLPIELMIEKSANEANAVSTNDVSLGEDKHRSVIKGWLQAKNKQFVENPPEIK